MRVLVTGGTGYIGAHLIKLLLESGNEPIGFGPLFEENILLKGISSENLIEGDILNKKQLEETVNHLKPAAIIHLAAYGSGFDGLLKSAMSFPEKALEVNLLGFYNVLKTAFECNVQRLIWSSSSTVYGNAKMYDNKKVDESVVTKPCTFYGLTKAMSEQMASYFARCHGLSLVGLRLPLIFGPHKWYKGAGSSIVDVFENNASDQEVIIKESDRPFDLMYVKDAVKMLYLLASEPGEKAELYNVKSYAVTFMELIDTVKSIKPDYNLRFENLICNDAVVYPLMDTTRINKDLPDASFYSFREACSDYLAELNNVAE